VLIDASRADFIDKDVIETIEDFMLHAPLKNITVELKRSMHKEQGFSNKPPDKKKDEALPVQNHKKEITKDTVN